MALNQLWPVIGVIQEEIKVLWDSHDARVLLFFLALVALLIFALILRRRSELAKRASMADPSNPTHVRKRDAIYSLGKDVVESGKDTINRARGILKAGKHPGRSRSQSSGSRDNLRGEWSDGKGYPRKRDRFRAFVRSILDDGRSRDDNGASSSVSVRRVRLNQAFFEADEPEEDEAPGFLLPGGRTNIPFELVYVLKSCEVFGGLPDRYFLHMYRHVTTINVPAGDRLSGIGDADDKMYIVLSGRLALRANEPVTGRQYLITTASTGQSVVSLLSMLDSICGHRSMFKSLSVHAEVDTTVLALPSSAFVELLQKEPAAVVRIMRMIIVRLHRVCFLTLYKFLGLTNELVVDTPEAAQRASENTLSSTTEKTTTNTTTRTPVSTVAGTSGATNAMHVLENNDALASVASAVTALAAEDCPQQQQQDEPHRKRSFTGAASFSNVASPSFPPPSSISSTIPAPILDRETKLDACRRFANTYQLGETARESLLAGAEERVTTIKTGVHLFHQGQHHPNIYFLVRGTVSVFIKSLTGDSDVHMYTAVPGEIVGLLAILSEEPCYLSAASDTDDCTVVVFTRADFEALVADDPSIFVRVARHLTARISPFVRQVDFALQWVHLKAGSALYRQGDLATSFFILLNGRVRSVQRMAGVRSSVSAPFSSSSSACPPSSSSSSSSSSDSVRVEDRGRGQLLGALELLSGERERVSTIHAVRDTELTRLPVGLFRLICDRFPLSIAHFYRIMGSGMMASFSSSPNSTANMSSIPTDAKPSRDTQQQQQPVSPARQGSLLDFLSNRHHCRDRAAASVAISPSAPSLPSSLNTAHRNLSTVAVIAASPNVPLRAFTQRLRVALSLIGPTKHLTSRSIARRFNGSDMAYRDAEMQLLAWLGQMEDHHRLVLYEAESEVTNWTKRCIRQADCILIVGVAGQPPELSEMERRIENVSQRVHKELVILHDIDSGKRPSGTAAWLNARPWCQQHHHIRCPSSMFTQHARASAVARANSVGSHGSSRNSGVTHGRPVSTSQMDPVQTIHSGDSATTGVGGGGGSSSDSDTSGTPTRVRFQRAHSLMGESSMSKSSEINLSGPELGRRSRATLQRGNTISATGFLSDTNLDSDTDDEDEDEMEKETDHHGTDATAGPSTASSSPSLGRRRPPNNGGGGGGGSSRPLLSSHGSGALSTALEMTTTGMGASSDFARLARWLTGTSIGLVLGGGGARGGAHVGCIRALEEANVPIDMVGGTSIGACVGALYAMSTSFKTVDADMSVFSASMASTWNKLVDLTYPATSLFTGAKFNESLRETIGEETLIEDMWLPYFNVSTDVTDNRMRVHTDGCAWRYVRASMTLAGYLPPICDPHDGNYLVDGGYVNNLPADVMAGQMGAGSVIAIDVGSKDHRQFLNYGDHISGWWLLWRRLNPLAWLRRGPSSTAAPANLEVPSMSDIQSRLAYVSSMAQLENVTSHPDWFYMHPEGVAAYQTLQFSAYADIRDLGFDYARARLGTWNDTRAVLPVIMRERRDSFFNNLSTLAADDDDTQTKRQEEGAQHLRAPLPAELLVSRSGRGHSLDKNDALNVMSVTRERTRSADH